VNSSFAIFLDLLLTALLVATIVYAVKLSRSIARLRDGKAELATLLQNLGEAVVRADSAISGMKAAAAEYDGSLSQQIGTARGLVDELRLINDSANSLATRIERAAETARPLAAGAPAEPAQPLVAARPGTAKPAKPAPAPARSSRNSVERELIEAIELLRKAG
jgi:hypothetical protein